MLSGFGTARSELLRCTMGSPHEKPASLAKLIPSGSTLLRRLLGVYPTYLIALLLGLSRAPELLNALSRALSGRDAQPGSVLFEPTFTGPMDEAKTLERWLIVSLEALLLHAYVPATMTKLPLTLNPPDWFVSALTLCWLLERVALRIASDMQRWLSGSGSTARLLLAMVAWMLLWPPVCCPLTWGGCTPYGAACEGLDHHWYSIAALQYVHHYVIGVLLAVELHARRALVTTASSTHERVPTDVRCGATSACTWMRTSCSATTACLALCGVFCVDLTWAGGPNASWKATPHGWYAPMWLYASWFSKVGLLAPIHWLLLAAIAEGGDVFFEGLARRFPRALAYCREVSLPIYLLQWPVHSWVAAVLDPSRRWGQSWWLFAVMLACLVALATLVSYGVQRPVARAIGGRLRQPGLNARS